MFDSPIPALCPSPIRTTHVGHWLRLALERFDERVRILMAQHPGAPLALPHCPGEQRSLAV